MDGGSRVVSTRPCERLRLRARARLLSERIWCNEKSISRATAANSQLVALVFWMGCRGGSTRRGAAADPCICWVETRRQARCLWVGGGPSQVLNCGGARAQPAHRSGAPPLGGRYACADPGTHFAGSADYVPEHGGWQPDPRKRSSDKQLCLLWLWPLPGDSISHQASAESIRR